MPIRLACLAMEVLSVVSTLWAAEPHAQNVPQAPLHGILYNEDDSNRFVLDPPGAMKPERLDRLVDELADSQVTAMLICSNAKKTAYKSKAWQPHCDGFDPSIGNQQPYFEGFPEKDREGARRWPHNQCVMFDAGVDPMQRMIDRCRTRKISPWVSVRMNDVHDAPLLKSPLHSRFWMEHPEYWRYPDCFRTWTDRCLNYALAPVRDHVMALIREVCDRYDMDGLELDWNRFPLHFREGEELQQSKMPQLLREIHSVETLADKDRNYAVTFTDISIPGKPIPPALPKTLAPGKSAEFSLFIGPKPLENARGQILLDLAADKPGDKTPVQVELNGRSAADANWRFTAGAFREGYNTVRVTSAGTTPMKVRSVEIALRFPSK